MKIRASRPDRDSAGGSSGQINRVATHSSSGRTNKPAFHADMGWVPVLLLDSKIQDLAPARRWDTKSGPATD
jgi:hypothetical protein